MTEREKMEAGILYNCADEELVALRFKAKGACFALNGLHPADYAGQQAILQSLFGKTGQNCFVTAPFWCDYGYNIEVGDNFYTNHNTVILDVCKVTFGNNVLVGPNCGFYTAGHPLHAAQRATGLEFGKPIAIGDDVWLGGGVQVMPGVTIGNGSVIGAGSVVAKSIPVGVVAAGNPCRALREITEEDKLPL